MPEPSPVYRSAKIPANVDAPDKIVAGLTARQAGILTGTAAGLWLLFQAVGPLIGPLEFLPAATLVLLVVAVLVTTTRDGVSLDRFVQSAIRHRATPQRQVLAPDGVAGPPAFLDAAMSGDRSTPAPFDSPVRDLDDDGVLDLGKDGVSVLAACTTVNFALRTPAEQEVLLGGFGRWLNSLTGPVAISSHSQPAQITGLIQTLCRDAPGLPHPALEAAAFEHAAFLDGLATHGGLLTRRILLSVHEDDSAKSSRLLRRAHDAAQLAACEIDVRTLPRAEAASVLTAAFNPQIPDSPDDEQDR